MRPGLQQPSTSIASRPASGSRVRRVLPAAALALAATVPSVSPAAAAPAPFTTCADDGQFHVTAVDVTPRTLVPGKKVSISASGTFERRLTGGTYHAEVRYRGFDVLRRSGPLGELIALPAQPGPATMTAAMKVPRKAPEGSYELAIFVVDQANDTVTCLIIPLRVR